MLVTDTVQLHSEVITAHAIKPGVLVIILPGLGLIQEITVHDPREERRVVGDSVEEVPAEHYNWSQSQ